MKAALKKSHFLKFRSVAYSLRHKILKKIFLSDLKLLNQHQEMNTSRWNKKDNV